MITLELPYPPTINHYYSYVHGRPVLSKEARSYRQRVRSIVMASGIKPLLGPLAARIEISPPDKRRRDCDNVQKSILDAMQHGGAFRDDSQIVWLLTVKLEPIPNGKATIKISESDDQSHLESMFTGSSQTFDRRNPK